MTKTILALLALFTVAAAQAVPNRIVLQNGQATNQIIITGSNKLAILNQVNMTNTFDTTSSTTTNLANYLRAFPVAIPTTSVGVAIAGSGTGSAITNEVRYYFQRSWDRVNWLDWTNASVIPAGTNYAYTNFVFTIGDYHYMRVYNVSNSNAGPPSGAWRSNLLELYYK